MNRLSNEKSSYLKHAASQKIDWYPWGEEAFERARQEDKPVFLSTGAVWCHWCHVMASECFHNEEIVKLMNDNFINIKLDRDERPDIDRLYQQAVSVMGSGGGWPLSVFLTPDKKPFFGGTYFPAEDKFERPGFKSILKAVINFYRTKKEDITVYTGRLVGVLMQNPAEQKGINESLLDGAVNGIMSEFDARNGGFGAAPKFPLPGVMDFLLNRYVLAKNGAAGYAVRKTLNAMAKGGFHDQLGGGFHRYSTDKAWIVPHFEKMADDNAWLLRNYAEAYAVFGDVYFREVAEGIVNFVKTVLSAPDGGFYSSQDADVVPDDEGGYFTWTDEDFRKALNGEEYAVMSQHFMHERGAMHHDANKKVLFVAVEAGDIAAKLDKSIEEINRIIKDGKTKLMNVRNSRQSPFIDRTFYTSLNAMLITAYLSAFRVLRDKSLKDFAIKTLDKITGEYWINNELFHSDGVKGLLYDYVYSTEALIAAYEVTGSISYFEKADALMERCIELFWDGSTGGFFDAGEPVIGVRLKGVEDISHPSANSVACMILLKLYHTSGKGIYLQYAGRTLKAFSANAEGGGMLYGYYYVALDAYYNMLRLALHTSPESELAFTALSYCKPHTSIVYKDTEGFVVPCMRDACHEPLRDPVSLREFLSEKKYLRNINNV